MNDTAIEAVAAIAAALEPFPPKVALSGLITVLATWVVENNINPSTVVGVFAHGVEVAELAAEKHKN